MLDALESHEIIGLLCAAESAGLIQGWKLLGPVIQIRRQGSNLFVPYVSAAGFLQELTAEC